MCRPLWFLDPGGWSKTTAVSLYFIFPGICTLSLIQPLLLLLLLLLLLHAFTAAVVHSKQTPQNVYSGHINNQDFVIKEKGEMLNSLREFFISSLWASITFCKSFLVMDSASSALVCEELCWDFDGDCIESIVCFWPYHRPNPFNGDNNMEASQKLSDLSKEKIFYSSVSNQPLDFCLFTLIR
ncbi:hypothetical protein STEG23_011453 [Scotinomys teguina]